MISNLLNKACVDGQGSKQLKLESIKAVCVVLFPNKLPSSCTHIKDMIAALEPFVLKKAANLYVSAQGVTAERNRGTENDSDYKRDSTSIL
jgi:hypothetical protein